MKIKYTTKPLSAKIKIERLREMHRQRKFNRNMSIVEFESVQDLNDFSKELGKSPGQIKTLEKNIKEQGSFCLNLLRPTLTFNGASPREIYEKTPGYYTIIKYRDL